MTELITVVIPTRDRIRLLERAVASVYERQARTPRVIVSDNSTRYEPAINGLRERYGFDYVSQGGRMGLVDHHNKCLAMATTPWVWLLHDDDEIAAGAVAEVESVLAGCKNAGILIGGAEIIDDQGSVGRTWIPCHTGTMRGEDALLKVGLDWQAKPPSQVFSTEAIARAGGYLNTAGLTADYAFALRLAYEDGVVFHPGVIGRFRQGHAHSGDFTSNPQRIDKWFEFLRLQVETVRSFGCSARAADQIADYLMWNSLRALAATRLGSEPRLVTGKVRFCLEHSPRRGAWQNRVRRDFPFLFWRPLRFGLSAYRVLVSLNRLARRVSPARAGALSERIQPLLFRSHPDDT